MAGAPTTTLDLALNAIGTTGNSWLSLHTADPGLTGASELSGGSPAYARKQTVWAASAGAVKSGSAQTLDIPAARTIGWFGVWTAASGGTWITGGPLRNAANTANVTESFTEQGQFALIPRLTADNLA